MFKKRNSAFKEHVSSNQLDLECFKVLDVNDFLNKYPGAEDSSASPFFKSGMRDNLDISQMVSWLSDDIEMLEATREFLMAYQSKYNQPEFDFSSEEKGVPNND